MGQFEGVFNQFEISWYRWALVEMVEYMEVGDEWIVEGIVVMGDWE